MAEKEGFEPSQALRPLSVFETDPFNRLGISPFRYYIMVFIFSNWTQAGNPQLRNQLPKYIILERFTMFIAIFPTLPVSPLLQDFFLGAIIILVTMIFILMFRHHDMRRHHLTLAKVYSYRIYSINIDTGNVTYFDKNNPRNIKTSNLDQFLKQYDAEDYYRVQTWLLNLIDIKKTNSWHLEVRATINSSKKTYFSVLEVTNVDYKTKTIHLNSYILRYLSPKKGMARRYSSNVISVEEANHRLQKTASNRGATYLIRFFYRKYSGNTGTYISAVFLKKLKDTITNYMGMGLYLVEQEATEIVLLETKNLSANEHRQIAHSIAHTIVKNLEISGLKEEVAFTIGVVENKYFPHHFEELLHHARLMANRAEKSSTLVEIFDQNQSYNEISVKTVELEVVDIIKSRKYEILFRPILDLGNYEISGYFSKIVINSTLTNNRLELSSLANDSESYRELLSNISRQLLTTFTGGRQTENQRVFIQASIHENNFILKSLAMMKRAKESHIVLLFDEIEINDWEANFDTISKLIHSYKDKGLETALAFKDMHLLLDKDIYGLFDYYVLDSRMTADILTDDRLRLEAHSLIDTLKEFTHPVIATDMADLDSVELMANFEVAGVSAECLGGYSSSLPTIEPKVIGRIKQFEVVKKN